MTCKRAMVIIEDDDGFVAVLEMTPRQEPGHFAMDCKTQFAPAGLIRPDGTRDQQPVGIDGSFKARGGSHALHRYEEGQAMYASAVACLDVLHFEPDTDEDDDDG